MAEPSADYLTELESEVGPIDAYAQKKLGYDTPEAFQQALFGYQVDGVAAAIHNMEQGKASIIADQTGMGKGREAASIIRYARQIGKVPVFVTEGPKLFTDMYNDSVDIGMDDIAPFIVNSGTAIRLEDPRSGKVTNKFKSGASTKQKALYDQMAQSGQLPEGSNALFVTYSQFGAQDAPQRKAIEALAPNALFIFDESHKMAGLPQTKVKTNKGFALAETTAGFLRRISTGQPTTYLSATYAKRPENMSAYTNTAIADAMPALEKDESDKIGMIDEISDPMTDVMAKGGAPLQSIVAEELTRRGQLIRREQTFDGITVNAHIDTTQSKRHKALYNNVVQALSAIANADAMFHARSVKAIKDELKGSNYEARAAGNKASSNVQHTSFSSVIHNYIQQLLLGLRTDVAAEKAIEAHKRGEKPVIGLVNTMGAFLDNYAEDTGLSPGDAFDATYNDVLKRALERTRRVKITKEGDSEVVNIPMDDLTPEVQAAYQRAEDAISSLDVSGIPMSPIDWMHYRMQEAGIRTAEITGRSLTIDYSDPNNPVLARRSPEETKDKGQHVDAFNLGRADALILNASGATGLSIHNSTRLPEDQQHKRHMIVAQMHPDTNVLMQMLGRINRVGQREEPELLPEFTFLSTSMPAEKRLMATSLAKMESLNANTSANTKGSMSFDAPVFLNTYGDQVVAEYLNENPDIAKRIDVPLYTPGPDQNQGGEPSVPVGYASKVTGKLAAFATVDEQQAFYDAVEASYNARIAYQDSIGENKLKAQTLDLQAKIIASTEIIPAQEGKPNTAISGRALAHDVDAIKLQKPATPEQVESDIGKEMAGRSAEQYLEGTLPAFDAKPFAQTLKKINGAIEKANSAQSVRSYIGTLRDDASNLEQVKSDIDSARESGLSKDDYATLRTLVNAKEVRLAASHKDISNFMRAYLPGRHIQVDLGGDGNLQDAAVVGYQFKAKADNPFALSQVRVNLQFASGLGAITLPASKGRKMFSRPNVELSVSDLFDPERTGSAEARERRVLVTGNLTAAMSLPNIRGQIARFTDSDGKNYNGLLLPASVSSMNDAVSDVEFRVDLSIDGADELLKALPNATELTGSDGIALVKKGDVYELRVPKSGSKKGSAIRMDRTIAYDGDFYTQPSQNYYAKNVRSPVSTARSLLMRHNIDFTLPEQHRDLYVKHGGTKKSGKGSFDVNKPDALLSRAEGRKSGMAFVDAESFVKRLNKHWPTGPKIKLYKTASEIPQAVRVLAGDERFSAIYATDTGQVHINLENVADTLSLEKAILHESQHYANSARMGPTYRKRVSELAEAIESQGESFIEGVRSVTDKLGIDYDYAGYDAFFRKMGLNDEQARTAHVEELTAAIAESSATTLGKIRLAARAVMAAIRQWLRDRGFKVSASLPTDMLIRQVRANMSYMRGLNSAPQPQKGRPFAYLSRFDEVSATIDSDRDHRLNVVRETLNRVPIDPDFKERVHGKLSKLGDTARKGALGVMTRRQLTEWGERFLPRMRQYLRLADQLDTDRRDLQVDGGHIAEEWAKLPKVAREMLASLMQAATVAGVDPSVPFVSKDQPDTNGMNLEQTANAMKIWADEDAYRKAQYKELNPRWDALSEDAKGIYTRARDHHEHLADEYESAVLSQVSEAMNKVGGKAAQIAKLKAKFETLRVDQPYFPLARFGPYWVSVKFGDKPTDRSVDAFETLREQARFVERMREEGHEVDFGTDMSELAQKMNVPMDFVATVDDILGGDQGNPELRDALYQAYLGTLPVMSARHHHQHRQNVRGFAEDALKAFSDSSFHSAYTVARTRHMSKLDGMLKGMEDDIKQAGKPADVLNKIADLKEFLTDVVGKKSLEDLQAAQQQTRDREQKNRLGRMQTLLKRFETADEARTELDVLELRQQTGELLSTPQLRNRATEYLTELSKNHERMKAPNVHWLASSLNGLGFGWFLGVTPAAAMVNLTQVPMVTLPILGSRYGAKKAFDEINRAYKEFFAAPPENPEMSENQLKHVSFRTIRTQLKGEEAAAFDELVRRGVIDVTQFHDLAGVAEEGQNYSGMVAKVSRVMSWSFHHAERSNREVTAMASYRLARQKGESVESAIDAAMDDTYTTQFDYGSTNRARFFSGNVARVIFQFRQYSAGITYLYVDTFRKALPWSTFTPEEKTQARRALAGLLGMQFAVTGSLGLPLSRAIGEIIEGIVGFWDEEDDWDYEAAMRQGTMNLIEAMTGSEAAGRTLSTALHKGAIDAFTPISIHGRLSISELWVRDSWQEVEGRDQANEYLKQLAGPIYGIGEGLAEGMSKMLSGDIYRGLETASPKVIRDVLKGGRYFAEDPTTASGNRIIDLGTHEAIIQALGFSPSRLSLQYDENRAKSNREKAVSSRRSELLRNMNDAREDGKPATMRGIQRDIADFNSKFPGSEITHKTLKRSQKSRETSREQTENGYRPRRQMGADDYNFGS